MPLVPIVTPPPVKLIVPVDPDINPVPVLSVLTTLMVRFSACMFMVLPLPL